MQQMKLIIPLSLSRVKTAELTFLTRLQLQILSQKVESISLGLHPVKVTLSLIQLRVSVLALNPVPATSLSIFQMQVK